MEQEHGRNEDESVMQEDTVKLPSLAPVKPNEEDGAPASEGDAATPVADAGVPLATEARVARYVVERVWRDEPGGRCYLAHVAEDGEAEATTEGAGAGQRAFLLEAREGAAIYQPLVALGLQHPRLLAPRAILDADGRTYLVLESLPASSEAPRTVSEGARLAPAETLRAGAGLADAIGYLHRNGVAHLHVSPDTLLVADGRAYLSGLETATILDEEPEIVQPLFARDVNFLARSLGVLADLPDVAPPDESAPLRSLRAIVARGVEGSFVTTDELAAQCAASLQPKTQAFSIAGIAEGQPQVTLRLRFAAATTVGRVRSENQDATATLLFDIHDDLPENLPMGIFVVADGMGGEARGELASRIGARIMSAEMARHFALPVIAFPATATPPETEGEATAEETTFSLVQKMVAAAAEANRQVRGLAQQLGQATGSTLTAVALCGTHAAIAHIGDSRAYLLHEGALIQLTEDHSLLARLQAMDHPLLNDPAFAMPRNFLYRSLGQEDDAPADSLEFTVQGGDRLLLCSDGLWDELDDQTLERELAAASDPEQGARRLVDLANEAGGHDNSTAVIVFVEAVEPEAIERVVQVVPDDELADDESSTNGRTSEETPTA